MEATTTMPASTRLLAATAVGYCGHWNGRADRHVEHVHAVSQRHLHGGHHDVGEGGPYAAKHLVRAERHPWSDALDVAVCADDAGDVGTVAVAVHRVIVGNGRIVGRIAGVERITDEVPTVRYAIALATTQVRVVVVDPGVHHRDLDLGAGEAELALREVGTGHRQRRHEFRTGTERHLGDTDLHHREHGHDARQLSQLGDLCRSGRHGQAVEQRLEVESLLVLDALGERDAAEQGSFVSLGGGRSTFHARRGGELHEPR
jgi:hypothetical protein